MKRLLERREAVSSIIEDATENIRFFHSMNTGETAGHNRQVEGYVQIIADESGKLQAKLDKACDVLTVIHRDGGQYISEHGYAVQIVLDLRAELGVA